MQGKRYGKGRHASALDRFIDNALEYVAIVAFLVVLGCTLAFGMIGLANYIVDHNRTDARGPSALFVDPSPLPGPVNDASRPTVKPIPPKHTTPTIVRVRPSRKPQGADPLGLSLNDHPSTASWNHGMTYSCRSGYQTLTIWPGATTVWHGARLKLDTKIAGGPRADPNHQQYVDLHLAGNLSYIKAHAASIVIVTDDADVDVHHDDRIANLSPSLITSTGLRLYTADFAHGGYILNLRLCAKI